MGLIENNIEEEAPQAPTGSDPTPLKKDSWPERRLGRIGVFRALQLGDLLCAVPAFRALRSRFPSAEITLIGLPWAREFAERFSCYLDEFIEFPGYPGFPEQGVCLEALPAFLTQVQQKKFDLVIQMHGNGSISNPLVGLWGARCTAGYYESGGFCPNPRTFFSYPSDDPEIWKHLRLLKFLGIPICGDALEFPLYSSDLKRLEDLPQSALFLTQRYICLHPGAREKARRWKPAYFAEVGDALANFGYQIILTGSAAERDLTDEVEGLMRSPSINLGGETDLGAVAALLSRACLLICNDTGVSHLAAALGTPSVILFHRSERHGWPPQDRLRHRVVARLDEVRPDDVLDEAVDLLQSRFSRRFSTPSFEPKRAASAL